MASVEQHYDRVLADVYSWMYGGWDAALERYREFFARHGVTPRGSRRAVDLGAGCGFQSIPLARLGFSVTAIDLDRKLLDELRRHSADAAIETVRDDLLGFRRHCRDGAELIVCMVDTLVHLESRVAVTHLVADVHAALEPGGTFIATFRDLTQEAEELDRFISVRSDEQTIFTCFLEYEPDTVKVHDLVYRRVDGQWQFHKSFYRKLRLSARWIDDALRAAGFAAVESSTERGLVTIVARK
jgi:protein-L-isoaspartate O-methyltransferase